MTKVHPFVVVPGHLVDRPGVVPLGQLLGDHLLFLGDGVPVVVAPTSDGGAPLLAGVGWEVVEDGRVHSAVGCKPNKITISITIRDHP